MLLSGGDATGGLKDDMQHAVGFAFPAVVGKGGAVLAGSQVSQRVGRVCP